MTQHPDHLLDAAAGWLARTNDPEFADWDGFMAWLEADPANADAYHQLADSEAELLPVVERLAPAPEPLSAPAVARPRRGWAIAAGLAALGALGLTAVPILSGKTYTTAPGEMRTIALADGDELVLNGGTQIHLAGLDRRDIRLDRGQLMLKLHGRDEGPVSVRAGDLEVVDVGTVFEVSRDETATRVLVSEGEVVADPDGARLHLSRGEGLTASDGETVLKAEKVAIDAAGSFSRGQLTYMGDPIARVAADLSRSTGIDFSTTPAMAQRPFSGTLSIAEVRRDPASLGPLLGVPVKSSGRGWIVGEGP
ncbi:FecR domain-containing protein [Sphingomonas rhizophila]|uniref:FecR domain-containing protein n=1 Tax=Sphingomonas rhizophila TaxID=2071607 RepID=A0A7G9SBS7_9SPHN|nr:FecR domain-containing protein [Sphingomonas rhizophila]QNN65302.1 FecR domain-containing protein [Sphingomonas rhizophila]